MPADLAEAIDQIIAGRRTHKAFDCSGIAPALVDKLIGLATLAPNHRLSNPWRFALLDRAAIARLGAWLPDQRQIVSVPDPEKGERKLRKLVEHYFPQLGCMIQVTWLRSDDATIDREDLAATAAACQNILLAAEARGLASFWASSPALRHPDTLRWCGADPTREGFVASIWLGGRSDEPKPPPRRPLSEVLRHP